MWEMWQAAIVSAVGTAAIVVCGQAALNRRKKSEESKKIRYSKIIIVLALTVMTGMLAANIVLCWRSGQQLDSSSVVAMSGFWGTEVFASAWIKVTETKNQTANQTIKKAQTETTPSGDPYEP